jgi:DNA-binding transcriptional MerR regulator
MRSSTGRNDTVEERQAHALPDHEEPPDLSTDPTRLDDDLRDVIERVQQQAETWRDMLSVSIGRARALTNLEETRIRYFEDLGALQPSKATGQVGASRLYTLSDLRCLYALALLVKDHAYRPAEAAKIVKIHRHLIESGLPGSIPALLSHEDHARIDAFLLARLMSQLLDAAQIELRQTSCELAYLSPPESICQARVIGLILPMHPLGIDAGALSADAVQRLGHALRQTPQNILVAIDRSAMAPPSSVQVPPALAESGRNDSTELFYSAEAWSIPYPEHCHYCLYLPEHRPDVAALLLVVVEPGSAGIPHVLRPRTPARVTLFDRILALGAALFHDIRNTMAVRNYWYRSDGFPIEHTQAAYRQLLEHIRSVIFPGDQQSMAVILTPNSLEHPTALSILAQQGYDADLALRVKLDLSGEGQGLSGRAYTMREPFFSLNARTDPRVAYAMEEHCQVALAVPLMPGWGATPFGVLYLASKSSSKALTSDVAYVGLILGTILGELLGRWWLNRLRRVRDFDLHQRAEETVRWLDSLDHHGLDFERALDHVKAIWDRIACEEGTQRDAPLALVVLDIDHYWQRVLAKSTDIVPLTAQRHVRGAIQKIVPDVHDYWFKNDHALLILENQGQDATLATVRRIANQVQALPFILPDAGGKKITLSVSAAIKILTYQDLYDLDSGGGTALRQQMRAIIDDLHAQTCRSPAHTIHVFAPSGWQSV